MPKEVECTDCISEDITSWRPTTGIRVKRCVTHVRAKKKQVKKRVRANRHLNTYGLSEYDVEELLIEQQGLCGICGPETGNRGLSRSLSTDHDHKCCAGSTSCGQCVRGFLCSGCNTYLGRIGDSTKVAVRMFRYLKEPPYQKILKRRASSELREDG